MVAKFDCIDAALSDGVDSNVADAPPSEVCAVANESGGTANASGVDESTAMR
jgi:hypothetical protein